jgi:hypothetical protein
MISGSARGASFSGIDQVLVVAIAYEHLRPTAEIHNQPSHAVPAWDAKLNSGRLGSTLRPILEALRNHCEWVE